MKDRFHAKRRCKHASKKMANKQGMPQAITQTTIGTGKAAGGDSDQS